TIQAQLTWGGIAQGWVTFTPNANNHPGDTYTLALQVVNPVGTTGLVPYSVEVKANDPTPQDLTLTGNYFIVANDASPFGPGWWLDGLDRLFSVTGGVKWVYGDGGVRTFLGTPGTLPYTFTSPTSDFGTLVENADNSFTYTAKDQQK